MIHPANTSLLCILSVQPVLMSAQHLTRIINQGNCYFWGKAAWKSPITWQVYCFIYLFKKKIAFVICSKTWSTRQRHKYTCNKNCKVLTVPSWSSKASVMILSRNMLKSLGESRHPCRTFQLLFGTSLLSLAIIAWKGFQLIGIFLFLSRTNLSLVCLGLLILFRRRWKVIITTSSHLLSIS